MQHFEGEVDIASSQFADRCVDQVISNHGGYGRCEPSGGGDECFRHSRCDGAQGGSSGGAQSVKGIDDAPNGSKQSDKRRHGTSDSEPWNIALQTRDLFRGCYLHRTLDGRQAMDGPGHTHLTAEFLYRRLKNTDQRAGTELFGNRCDVLHALRLAEGPHKASALRTCTAQQPPSG